MRTLAMSVFVTLMLLSGCAWTPVVHQFPSGLRIVRGDSTLLLQACSGELRDDGSKRTPGVAPSGCWSATDNTIYIKNSCEGAQVLIHELAHKEGIPQPSKEGYDW